METGNLFGRMNSRVTNWTGQIGRLTWEQGHHLLKNMDIVRHILYLKIFQAIIFQFAGKEKLK